MKLRTILFTAAAIIGMPIFAGCATHEIAGQAGEFVYSGGKLKADLQAPLKACEHAANNAIGTLAFRKVSQDDTAGAVKIYARDYFDRTVTIQLQALSDHLTRLTVHVGVWGDKTASKQFLIVLKEKTALAQTPPVTAPLRAGL